MNDKKVFFTYIRDENGEISLNRVFIFDMDSRKTEMDYFDIEKHGELFENFISNRNISGETLVSELEEKGLFNEDEITSEKMRNYVFGENSFSLDQMTTGNFGEEDYDQSEYTETNEYNDINEYDDYDESDNSDELDDSDEYVEDNTKNNTAAKRFLAGVLAAGAVVGTLSLLHSCDQETIIDETKEQTLEDLINQMSPEQRAFFESTFQAIEKFNDNAKKEGNFVLEQDQTTLHMTIDEGIALNIIMNNYSSEDLYDIFGTVGFDATELMNLARSAYGKLSTYYMNAKEASGISQLINDEAARAFFEKHENEVIDFNNNPSTELADSVIKGMYNDYIYNGSNGEYNKINNDGVAWIATAPVFGYELANRNVPEFLKSKDGLSLNQITTSKLLNGINEEVKLDVMDGVDNLSLCAAVTKKTEVKVSGLKVSQNVVSAMIKENAKNDLFEGLKENGNISLANKVLVNGINPDLLKEISESSSKNNELVDEYNTQLSLLEEREAKIIATLELAKERYNSKEEVDIAELVNNRFRSPLVNTKQPVKDNSSSTTTKEDKKEQLKEDLYVGKDNDGTPVYDGDKFGELSQKEQDEFVKNNGVVIDEKKEVIKQEEVEYEDLTPKEQEIVVDKEAILKEVESVENTLITQGVYDALDYTEKKGVYDYEGTIVIPYNNEELDTSNMSLWNITAYDEAYGKGDVNNIRKNKQIQGEIENADNTIDRSAAYILNGFSPEAQIYLEEKYGSDWREKFTDETYVNAFVKQLVDSLDIADEYGKKLRIEAEDAYNKAQERVNQMNQEENKEEEDSSKVTTPSLGVPDSSNGTNTDNNDEYDPNLDPSYRQEDEQPYIPNVPIETPGYYFDDSDLENAFNAAMDEVGKSK